MEMQSGARNEARHEAAMSVFGADGTEYHPGWGLDAVSMALDAWAMALVVLCSPRTLDLWWATQWHNESLSLLEMVAAPPHDVAAPPRLDRAVEMLNAFEAYSVRIEGGRGQHASASR